MPTKRPWMQKRAIRKRKVKSARRNAAKRKRRAVAKRAAVTKQLPTVPAAVSPLKGTN
jgi:hypothetical protein